MELTHLLSSLSWDARSSRQPGITRAVRAVTLRGVGTHQDPGAGTAHCPLPTAHCPLPTAHLRALPSPPRASSAPQSPHNAGTVLDAQQGPSPGSRGWDKDSSATHPSLLRSRELREALEENPGVTQLREPARIPSGTSVPSACPQCPQSPSGARCFPQFPHNPIPRDSGAPLHLPPHCQGVSGTQIPTQSCGNTHPGTVLAARGTRHAPIPFLPLQSPRSFQGRLQLGTVPAESLGGKGESGAPRGVPRGRRVTPSPPSHLQHLDVPLGHDGQRSLEKREGGMEKRDGRMEGGRDGGRDCPRGGGAGQGTLPWELSPPYQISSRSRQSGQAVVSRHSLNPRGRRVLKPCPKRSGSFPLSRLPLPSPIAHLATGGTGRAGRAGSSGGTLQDPKKRSERGEG